MPEFLSEAWFDALATALEGLHARASATDHPGLALGQIVTEVPQGNAGLTTQGGEVHFTIVLRPDGSASLVRDSTAEANVILVEDWLTAEAVASGMSSVSDMLSAGKIKMRGDSRALMAAGDMLATIAPVVLEALGGSS